MTQHDDNGVARRGADSVGQKRYGIGPLCYQQPGWNERNSQEIRKQIGFEIGRAKCEKRPTKEAGNRSRNDPICPGFLGS
jgi:hypothetical protein